jgi:adenosylmethionine-8-amino-7-oxononanoate aminotransferase
MPSKCSEITPEQLDNHHEYQRKYREKNRKKIKTLKRKSRTLTRTENRNDIRAIITKHPIVNMRDTMHLSVEKFLEKAEQYCRENL